MTVAAQDVAPRIVAAAGQFAFPFAWRCDSSNLVAVYVNDTADGGFAVALNADQIAAPGGIVTRASAAIGGEVVAIERVSPLTQTTAFTKYGPFPASTITNFLDLMVMLLQEIAAKLVRVVTIRRSTAVLLLSTDLPTPVDGSVLAWVKVGAQYQLTSLAAAAALPGALAVFGEALVDSGDHTNFSSAFAPTAARMLYRNGQRIFSPGDYTVVGNTWTTTTPLNPALGEVLNADYAHA